VRTEPDEGQADALNRAIERTTGNVVVWLNADDLLIAGAFAAVAAAFQEHPDADFVYGDFEVVDGDGSTLRRFRSSRYDPKRVFVHGCYIFSGAIFFRRETIERLGPFDARLQACMDFDYLMRMGEARAVHVPQAVARFRLSPGQKSAAIRTRFLKESHKIRWRAAGRSAYRRLLVLMLTARDAAYLSTHRLRFSSAWSTIRRNRQL
jgi:glycosyltransferase involved in cell wall biosynthesis